LENEVSFSNAYYVYKKHLAFHVSLSVMYRT